MRERITLLRRGLKRVRAHRGLHRLKRDAVPLPLVSLVGYTNAGKSTLMNAMTGAEVFVEDKLFATLDPTVRRLKLPSGREVLLADTVGFIRRLPHQLVESFRSTFEEVAHAKLLLHVIDGSDEEASAQADVVEGVLKELELSGKPRIDVVNKCDVPGSCGAGGRESLRISAATGEGVGMLLQRIDDVLRMEFRRSLLKLPADRGDIVSALYRLGYVTGVRYEADWIFLECELHEKFIGKYRRFVMDV